MKTANYDFILSFFKSSNPKTPTLRQASLQDNGCVYATDSYMCVKIPSDNLTGEYKKVDNFPKAENIFENYTEEHKGKISTDYLISLLSTYKQIRDYETVDCDKCYGSGEIECECCGQDCDCEECNGDGEKYIGNLECGLLVAENHESLIEIAKKAFRVDFISTIAVCAKILNVEEITVSYNTNKHQGTLFIIGDATILLMPRVDYESEEFKTVTLS